MSKRPTVLLGAVLLTASLVIASCGSSGTSAGSESQAGSQSETTSDTSSASSAPTATDATTESSSQDPAAETSTSEGEAASEGPLRVKPVDKNLDGKRIALLSFANNPYWDPVQAGSKAANDALKAHGATVDYIVAGPNLEVPAVISAIEGAVTQGYDAIGVVSLTQGTCPAIKAAVDQGVAVATFIIEGACSEESGSLFYYGMNNYAAGQAAADAMVKAIGDDGQVAIITGSYGAESQEDRRHGFEDQMTKSHPGIKIVGTTENKDDAGTALSQANDFMTAYPDLKGIYLTAGGPFGAAQAVEQAGKADQVKLVSYDLVPETLAFVKKGIIAATIGGDAFGDSYNTAMLLFNYLADGSKPAEYFQQEPFGIVTPENVDEVLSAQG